MPLVYLPDSEALFLWGTDAVPKDFPDLGRTGPRERESWTTRLVTPEGLRDVSGVKLALFETAATLAVTPAAQLETLPASLAIWTLASKLGMELVSRERVVPTISRHHGRVEAHWAAALSAS